MPQLQLFCSYYFMSFDLTVTVAHWCHISLCKWASKFLGKLWFLFFLILTHLCCILLNVYILCKIIRLFPIPFCIKFYSNHKYHFFSFSLPLSFCFHFLFFFFFFPKNLKARKRMYLMLLFYLWTISSVSPMPISKWLPVDHIVCSTSS